MSRLNNNVHPRTATEVTPQPGTPVNLPVRPIYNPLNSEDEAVLDQVIQRTHVHHDLTQRMSQAGIDTSEYENRNAMHHHVASTLKKLFFPTTMTPPHAES